MSQRMIRQKPYNEYITTHRVHKIPCTVDLKQLQDNKENNYQKGNDMNDQDTNEALLTKEQISQAVKKLNTQVQAADVGNMKQKIGS